MAPSFLVGLIKAVNEDAPYFYSKAIVKDKHIEDGILGRKNYYIKVELADRTNKIIQTKTENYLLAELNQEIIIVLDTEKNDIKKIIFNDTELKNYIDLQNKMGRKIKILD